MSGHSNECPAIHGLLTKYWTIAAILKELGVTLTSVYRA